MTVAEAKVILAQNDGGGLRLYEGRNLQTGKIDCFLIQWDGAGGVYLRAETRGEAYKEAAEIVRREIADEQAGYPCP